MKLETSSGGIIYRKNGKDIEILLLKDQRGNWTFPKGLVEKREKEVDAAIREIKEEVGLSSIKYISDAGTIQYFYKWEGKLVKKLVYYFIFLFTGNEIPIPQADEGIQEIMWYPIDEVINVVGYKKTNKEVLEKAIERIKITQSSNNPINYQMKKLKKLLIILHLIIYLFIGSIGLLVFIGLL